MRVPEDIITRNSWGTRLVIKRKMLTTALRALVNNQF